MLDDPREKFYDQLWRATHAYRDATCMEKLLYMTRSIKRRFLYMSNQAALMALRKVMQYVDKD